MSSQTGNEFETDLYPAPRARRSQLSANGHWVFGSIYAAMAFLGFAFGVWAGVPKPKAIEVADAKKDAEKPVPKSPPTAPPVTTPTPPPVVPLPVEPKKEPEAKPKEPAPKPKEPDPKPKQPDPKPKPKEPEPKKPDRVVLYKEVQPILRKYCNDCHGASAGKPKGGVDLTSVAKILKSKGPPLVPGKPDDSTVYTSTKNGDMPPDGKKGPDEKELQLLRDWIAGGAKERRRTPRGLVARRRKLELTRAAAPG